jgi:hypothetical protein
MSLLTKASASKRHSGFLSNSDLIISLMKGDTVGGREARSGSLSLIANVKANTFSHGNG